MAAKPAGHGTWYSRARRWLPGGYQEVERLLGLAQLEVPERPASRELELATRAGMTFNLEEADAAIAAGIVFTSADGADARSRALGASQGLELWGHAHALHKGVGPSWPNTRYPCPPARAASMSELQPAVRRAKEHIRGAPAAGHPLDDTRRVIALRGILPMALIKPLGRRGRHGALGGDLRHAAALGRVPAGAGPCEGSVAWSLEGQGFE